MVVTNFITNELDFYRQMEATSTYAIFHFSKNVLRRVWAFLWISLPGFGYVHPNSTTNLPLNEKIGKTVKKSSLR